MAVSMRRVVLGILLAALCPVLAQAGELSLTIRDGRVSLVARDVTVRQILAEWARVGQTRIVNLERVPGGPVTLEFRDLPESQALSVILRSLAGFMAAPRAEPEATLSRYDRIIVMPTLATPAPVSASAGPARQPGMVQPNPGVRPMPGLDPARMRGGRFETVTDPEEAETSDDEPETVADEIRQQQLGRPPLGMRPGPPAFRRENPPADATPEPATTPGMITPAGGLTRPGVVPTPPKPPGDPK